MTSSRQSGFTLVEISVVVLIIGLLIGGTFTMMKPYLQMAKHNATQAKLENISRQLALYAQNYGRLPCPADPSTVDGGTPPFGAPRGSGANGTVVNQPCGALADHVGMLPFRALGLTEDQARDAYNNLITYAVSPMLTKLDPANMTEAVHDQCRTPIWIDGGTNRNPRKAELCCVNHASGGERDLQILDSRTGGTSLFAGRTFNAAQTGADYAAPDIPHPATNTETRLIAFTLVSHGPNGDGAYIAHRSDRNGITAAANAQESANYDGDMDFVSRPRTETDDNEYFDDIVVWRTNQQLVGAFDNDSCARP